MFKVLYVWDADYPWDVRTEKVCATLRARGFDVRLVARNRDRRPVIEHVAEAAVVRMRPLRWAGKRLDDVLSFPAFFNPRWVALIGDAIRTFRPDLIIVRDVPLCPTALLLGRRAGVPVVMDMAENYAAMMRQLWDARRQRPLDFLVRNPAVVGFVERQCLRRLDAVITVVEESSDRLRALGVPVDRLTVVSNTPPVRRAREDAAVTGAADDPVEVVYLGLLELHRGLGDVVEAAALLRDRQRRVRITIVGGGRDEAILRAFAAERGLTDEHLVFVGRVPHDEALRLVGRAGIGLVPHRADDSWNTTIPNKLFDYMAGGLAVVSSDAIPARRIVSETGAGVVYRSGDALALASAIEWLLEPARRDACARAGLEAIRSRYNWEQDADRLIALVDRLTQRAVRA